MYAQVIVDIAHSQVDKIFEYSCPDGVRAGCRVRVPFGGRIVDGFVTGVSQTCALPPQKIKPVAEVLDEPPALVKECLMLTELISARYKVPKAASMRLFLPSEMRLGKVKERYKRFVLLKADMPLAKPAVKQAQALEYIKAQGGRCPLSDLVEKFGRGAINGLVQKGIAQFQNEKITRDPLPGDYGDEEPKILTSYQQNALASIRASKKCVQLLHGVTGSGKTEVYLQLIAEAIAEGKTAIFLVPEISLTPQMLKRLRARFKGEAAILHSGLSAGEKFDEWWRLRSGEAKIAIGARSAIFAPVENVGAIIIDEEHDSSYISESAPRYNTLDIALWRAQYNGCKLILGSATPSVESFLKAEEGEYNLISMPERINKRPLPQIIIADMRKEVKRGNNTAFSQALREELAQTLQSGNQAIIFLNRRGYSQTVICRDCGYVAKCENCDVTLTYHSEDNCLKCHYCGARYRMLESCPECGGRHIRYNGTGTQRVVADLQELFPSARLIRMDNDTVSGKDGHYKILSKFASHEADILVGTQMIAKGHDFPAVTLVGILDADMSLHFADYRSGERTFQLITQVAGRSGRAEQKGKVVLQTYSPENYILRYAVNYDYIGFFKNERDIREATQFPPYSVICRVMVTSGDDNSALAALKEVWFAVEELKNAHPGEFLFANRMHSPIKRIQGKFRYQVLMRLATPALLKDIYDIAAGATSGSVLCYVEENPVNLS